MQYKTRGIIIKSKKFGEADRILTVYTETRGKTTALAKGSRKILSKLAGHLELFYLSDLVLAEGKNIDTITGAKLLEDFPSLRKDPCRISQAYFLAELMDKLIKEKEPAKELFDLLLKTLKRLDGGRNSLLLPYFELQLLSHLGHRPELEVCVKCRRKLKPKINYFSSLLGGIVCKDCRSYDMGSNGISSDTIKLLRLILLQDISIIDKVNAQAKSEKEAKRILFNFIRTVAERELKTISFVELLF